MADSKPSPKELMEAEGKIVEDLIAPGLKVLLVGINPGLYSGATGYHFARPGNSFLARVAASAQELRPEEYREGARQLEEKVRIYRPKVVCILSIGAYRTGFERPKAQLGLQQETIAGVPVWVLPNPSGLNAHVQVEDFGRMLAEVRGAAEA